jgi:two-component sensor histidine kinase
MAEQDAAALTAALEAQAALQRESDHRMKNVLQLICSLLMLQGRRAASPEVQAALTAALQRATAVSVAARHVERIDGVERTDLTALIREIATELATRTRRDDVAIDLDLEPLTLPARHGGALALIVNEAVGNALAHGFNGRGGRIKVGVRRAGDELVLSVHDDGIGVDGELPKGFGLTIAGLMAQQLRGRLETDVSQPGFRLAVHVPMPDAKP